MERDYRKIKAVEAVMPDYEKYAEEIKSIWDTGILTNYGEKTQKFKQILCEYMKLSNVDLFVNGHAALLLAIKAFSLQGEVITSPFTFISTTHAIVQNGLVPVFGDIDDSYNLSPDCIEELITPKTCAIIVPHIFGIPCEVERIKEIADRHHLKVIYDGAQAFGTKIKGQAIGAYGDITMFSFHAIKVFNSIEGGMLSYCDSKLHDKFEKERNFGIFYGEYGNDVRYEGINAKMNEFQAAMGIANLPMLENEIEKRKMLAGMYIERLKDIPGILTYNYKEEIEYNYAYFPIKIAEEYGAGRDDLWLGLMNAGIETRKLYDKLTCDYSCYKDRDYKRITRHADKVKTMCLDLPLYGSLSEPDIIYICETIQKLRR